MLALPDQLLDVFIVCKRDLPDERPPNSPVALTDDTCMKVEDGLWLVRVRGKDIAKFKEAGYKIERVYNYQIIA